MIHKIEKYYRFKKAKDVLDKQLKELSEDIRSSLEPGEHSIGPYKVNIILNSSLHVDRAEEEIEIVQENLQRNSQR